MIQNKHFSFNSDKVGMISSLLCLVHCLALPTVISLEPLLGDFLTKDFIFLEYIFLILSVLAVYFSTRHTSSLLKTSFYLALSIFTIAILLEQYFFWIHYLAYLGSFGLIVTHLINYYRCRQGEIIPPKTAFGSPKKLFFEKIYHPHATNSKCPGQF